MCFANPAKGGGSGVIRPAERDSPSPLPVLAGFAKYIADQGGAYWLLDEIALSQRYEKRVSGEEFQLWKLTVAKDKTATLVCEDSNGRVVFSKPIPYTDFPLDEISLYFINNTILLPSEY
jgi:hypothetical protein